MTTKPPQLLSGLALVLGCQPAGAPAQDPAQAPAPVSPPAAVASPADDGDARPPTLSKFSEIEAAIGQRVVIVGTAREAKLVAVVLVEASPIYCIGQERWPEGVEGEQVEVTGTLSRTDRFAARVDADGAVSQGTEGAIVVIEPCAFHLLTVDDAR